MTNQKCLVVRLTKTQHERIKIDAEAKGYKTISQYIRSITLEHDLSYQKKFDEMYHKLVPEEEYTQKNKEKTLMEFI